MRAWKAAIRVGWLYVRYCFLGSMIGFNGGDTC